MDVLGTREVAERTREYSTMVIRYGKLAQPLDLLPKPFASEKEQAAAFLSEARICTDDCQVNLSELASSAANAIETMTSSIQSAAPLVAFLPDLSMKEQPSC